jgi:hypothetical protein
MERALRSAVDDADFAADVRQRLGTDLDAKTKARRPADAACSVVFSTMRAPRTDRYARASNAREVTRV